MDSLALSLLRPSQPLLFNRWRCFHAGVAKTQVKVCLWWAVWSHPAASSWHFASVSCVLPRALFADGLTFSLPLVLTAVRHCSLVCHLWIAPHWLFHCLLCPFCFSQTLHLCVFFLVSLFVFGLSFWNSIKALAHTHSFPVVLFHHRNRDDPRKVCLAAERGSPPLSFFFSLLCCASVSACFTWPLCSGCCFTLSDPFGGWGVRQLPSIKIKYNCHDFIVFLYSYFFSYN